MRTRIVLALLTSVLAMLPGTSSADYLYSAFRDVTYEPYVMFILDNSGSMVTTDSSGSGNTLVCPYGFVSGSSTTCKTRADAAREVVSDLVANLDGTEMGLIHFNTSTDPSKNTTDNGCVSGENINSCGRTVVASPGSGDTRTPILTAISKASFNTNTPIALALRDAGEALKAVATKDTSVACRKYYVILLSDGEDNCCRNPVTETKSLRSISAGGKTIDLRTFVIGFGKDVANSPNLTQMAREGGTARLNGQWECWDPTGTRTNVPATCTGGSAIFAGDTASLKAAIEEVLSAIRSGYFTGMSSVIGSVAQTRSESDRVSQNLMTYTAFGMPDYQGHVFGVRLFAETAPRTNVWEFTDFTKLDLTKCGNEGNPCVFDGGQRLYDRVRKPGAKARRIWTSALFSVDHQDANGGATSRTDLGIRLRPKAAPLELTNDAAGAAALRTAATELFKADPFKAIWDNRNASGGLASLATAHPDRIAALLDADAGQRGTMLAWLHGHPSARPWPLGDPYHGGAAIVESPPNPYRTRGYPTFRETLRNRPAMVYVPTNDGMLHAFHAGPDILALQRNGREAPTCDIDEAWCPGDEAWAYLPVSMLARSAVEILGGAQRFFSMDLSCRVDDMLVHDNRDSQAASGFNCEKDPDDPNLCGWRTVLLCGQGWGGNWYVALDVTKPLAPRALWELTFDDGAKGFGRTWSLPGIGLIELDGFPRWVAFAGNGYNTDLKPKGGSTHRAYRLLNLPFTGAFAHHGDGTAGDNDHVYAFDVADGRILRSFDTSLGAVIAELTLVDVDRDGFAEAAYVAGWNGGLHRIGLGGGGGARPAEDPASWGYCESLFSFSGKPLPNRPVILADPQKAERLYVIAASGQDTGSFPDDATNINASYDLDGWYVDDDGGTPCKAVSTPKGSVSGNGNMCKDNSSGLKMNGLFNQGQGKRRLMSAPIIASQANGERWLTFTAWDPPKNSCGGDGESALYCLKWSTDPSACGYCGDLNGDGVINAKDESIVISHEITTSPNSADGQIYIATENGLQRIRNQDGRSGTNANSNAPRNVVVSWREVF